MTHAQVTHRPLLLVEDTDDVREAFREFLSGEGFQVTAVSSRTEAIEALGSMHYAFVVTDYALGDGTGQELLDDAAARGYLEGTSVLILSAHVRPQACDYTWLTKPVDLDGFIQRILDEPPFAYAPGKAPPPVELVLYVSRHSTQAPAAVRSVEETLQRFDTSKVQLTVRWIEETPAPTLREDHVSVTPLLLKQGPLPRAWFVGNFQHTSTKLAAWLDATSAPRKASS